MLGIQDLALFVTSGILLNITPGQDTMYIVTRSLAQGSRAGFLSVCGISSGLLVHTFAAAFGLSAILNTSALLFQVIKTLGALYLIYLGLRMISAPPLLFPHAGGVPAADPSWGKIYRQGLVTNILNPKVALFFLAFMPQFISSQSEHHTLAFLLLGAVFVSTASLWFLCLTWLTSRVGDRLHAHGFLAKRMPQLAGAVFIGLGLQLSFHS